MPVAANDDPGFEIRRQNKTKPTVVAVAIAAVVAVLLVRDPGGSFDDGPVTTTIPLSEQTTTSAGEADTANSTTPTSTEVAFEGPDIRGLGDRLGGGFAFRWSPGSMSIQEIAALDLGPESQAVAVDDLVVFIDDEGTLRLLRVGHSAEELACCYQGLTASNEPRHVWALLDNHAVLFDLDTRQDSTLALGGRRVLGPGSFGLVTVDDQERAVWLRPDFDPSPIDAPDGRIAIGAGGDVVLYLVSGTDAVEVRRLTDGALVRSFREPGEGSVTASISTSGDAVAVTRQGTTVVFSLPSGDALASFRTGDAQVVPVGARRFAAVVDGELVDSSERVVALAAQRAIVATRAE